MATQDTPNTPHVPDGGPQAELAELLEAGLPLEEAASMVAARASARELSARLDAIVQHLLSDAQDSPPGSPGPRHD